jgi:tetratricopeptide (TPR) repeat protein
MEWIDSSLAASETAISLNPDLAEGYKARGSAYMVLGKYRESLEATTRAVELNPNLEPAVSNMGFKNLLIGRADEAIRWYKRALSLTDQIGFTESGLAMAYDVLLMDDLAREYYEKCLVKRPDDVWVRFWYALFCLRRDERAQVVEQIEEIERFHPGHHYASVLRADLAVEDEDYEAAETQIEKALASIPEGSGEAAIHVPGYLTFQGFVRMKLGDTDGGKRSLDAASEMVQHDIENHTQDWMTYSLAGGIEGLRGDTEGALQYLRQSIDMGCTDLHDLETDPIFDNLRGNRTFDELVARVREKIARQRKRVE